MALGARIVRIGKNIQMCRDRVNMTQNDLAARVGFSSGATISAIEAGEKAPSIEKLLDIAIQLGVSVAQLTGEPGVQAAQITNNANGDHQTVYQHVDGQVLFTEELQAAMRVLVREELARHREALAQDIREGVRAVIDATRPRDASGRMRWTEPPNGPGAPAAPGPDVGLVDQG